MAVNKPKLIYLNSSSGNLDNLTKILTWITDNGGADWNSSSNDFYHSIVYSTTGYFITHGKVFNGNNNTYTLTLNGTGNGTTSGTSLGSFYAPTSSGTSGLVLISGGSNTTPTWLSLSTSLSTSSTNSQIPSAKAVVDYIANGLAANDAMVFKGTLGTGGTITSVPTSGYSAGDTYRIITAGPYAGKVCEIGDLLIAISDGPASGSSVTDSHWTVAQTNIDGAVTASNALTANGIVLGNNNKTVKILTTTNTSGYLKPNGSSAPAWSSFGTLTLDGTTDFNFSPATNKKLIIGKGIDITSVIENNVTTYTLGHSNSISAITTAGLYKFKHDAHGHITGTTAITKADITGLGIPASNTWRPIYAYTESTLSDLAERLGGDTGTKALLFGLEFIYTEGDSGGVNGAAEIHLAWADVAADGTTITYVA